MTHQAFLSLVSESNIPITALDAAGDIWVIECDRAGQTTARCTVQNLPSDLHRYGFESMARFHEVNPQVVKISSLPACIAIA